MVESAAARYLGKNTMDYETQSGPGKSDKIPGQILTDWAMMQNSNWIRKGIDRDSKNSYKNRISIFWLWENMDIKDLKDLIFGTTIDAVRHKVKVPLLL